MKTNLNISFSIKEARILSKVLANQLDSEMRCFIDEKKEREFSYAEILTIKNKIETIA